MGGVDWFLIFALAHVATLVFLFRAGYLLGFRAGKRFETKTMIELLDSLKIDNWEQTVFRDRFKRALQWVLDGKRKKDRNASNPPSNG